MLKMQSDKAVDEFIAASVRSAASELNSIVASIDMNSWPEREDLETQLDLVVSRINMTKKIIKKGR